ncbi:MAG: sel1 repeat family protein [Deltaproteobacteria bacterium]|jgi:TPR repeat protein|nr:sel1 repeat family protein [Deltaproteobacteria bacterium]
MKKFAILWVLLFLWIPFHGQAAIGATQAGPPASTQAEPSGMDVQSVPQRMEPEAAFALMSAEAEKGNSGAMLTLGRFYEQGIGIARNYTKAMEWYEKAAKTGQPEGYYNLGVCFEIGIGVTADASRAFIHYQKAADLGLAQAMYKLSSLCIAGIGTSKDVARGMDYLKQAAEAGMSVAANELGVIYLSGLIGQKKDEKMALTMFMRAADLGHLEAVKNIAIMHKDGLGIKADPATAYTWYLIARRGGYAGEDLARLLGLLEGSLSEDQIQKARQAADAWIENYANKASSR